MLAGSTIRIPPFDDAATEGKFDGWAVVGKILAGIAVAVTVGLAVAGLTLLTGGAALPVLAAIGINATATGLAVTAGAITVAAGAAAAIKQGIDDSQRGNVSGLGNYLSASFDSSMCTGAAVLTAVNLLSTVGSIGAIANDLKGLTIGLTEMLDANGASIGYQLVVSGGAVALADVEALLASLGLIAFARVWGNPTSGNPSGVSGTRGTSSRREELLGRAQNPELKKIITELYRSEASTADGGSTAKLVEEVKKGLLNEKGVYKYLQNF